MVSVISSPLSEKCTNCHVRRDVGTVLPRWILVLINSDLFFSTICGQIFVVACGKIPFDVLELMLTFFEVSLSR